MRFSCRTAILAALTCSISHPAFALHRTPVRALDGYRCMALDAPERVMMDFRHPIPLQSEPRDGAPSIAPALAVLPIATDAPPTNGYVRSMTLALRPGWVSTRWLKPYDAVHPGMTCTPYVMNDGKLGFVFGRAAQ